MTVDHDKLVRFVAKIVGPNDAEDVAQEVYVKLLQPHATYRGQAGVETWVFAVAKNIARDWLRDRGPRTVPLEDVMTLDSRRDSTRRRRRESPLAIPPEEFGELSLEMRQALKTLTPRERAALLMCVKHGDDTAAAAEELGIAPDTYADWLWHARRRMKELVTP